MRQLPKVVVPGAAQGLRAARRRAEARQRVDGVGVSHAYITGVRRREASVGTWFGFDGAVAGFRS
jgi:hypothetical protein